MRTLIAMTILLLTPVIQGLAIVPTTFAKQKNPANIEHSSTVLGVPVLNEYQPAERIKPEATTESGQYKSTVHGATPPVEYPDARGSKPEVVAEADQERSTVHGVQPLVEYQHSEGLKPEATTGGSQYSSTVHGVQPLVENQHTEGIKPEVTTEGSQYSSTVHGVQPVVENQHTEGLKLETSTEGSQYSSTVHGVQPVVENQHTEGLKLETSTGGSQYSSTVHGVQPVVENQHTEGLKLETSTEGSQYSSTVHGVQPVVEYQHTEGLKPETSTESIRYSSTVHGVQPVVEYQHTEGLKPETSTEGIRFSSTVHGVQPVVEYQYTEGIKPEATTDGSQYSSTIDGVQPVVEYQHTGDLKPEATTEGSQYTSTVHGVPPTVQFPKVTAEFDQEKSTVHGVRPVVEYQHTESLKPEATTEGNQYTSTVQGVPPMVEYPHTGGLKQEITTEGGQNKPTVTGVPPLTEYPQAGGPNQAVTTESSQIGGLKQDTPAESSQVKSHVEGSAPAENNYVKTTPLDDNPDFAHHAVGIPEPEPGPYTELRNQSEIVRVNTGIEDRAREVPGEDAEVHGQKNRSNIRPKNWGETKKEEVVEESHVNRTAYVSSNKTHFDDEEVPSETTEFDQEELPFNKTHFHIESTNETESESIQEMLDKLNIMIEKHKQCNHNLEPDIGPTFSTTRSDVQGDSDTEENNETKRTIKEIIKKLNGIMFYGSRCSRDKNETEDNEYERTTFPKSSLIVVTREPSVELRNETESKAEQKPQDNRIDIADDIFDNESLDWSVFEHYPQEPKIRLIFDIECRVDLKEKKTKKEVVPIDYENWHVSYNHSDRPYHSLHWDHEQRGPKTNCENQVPSDKIEEDHSCPRHNGYRRPCFDIMSQESVLSQLCERLSSLEEDINKVTSQVDSQRHQTNRDRFDAISGLRSEIVELKKEIATMRRRSAFYASAYLNLGQVQGFTEQINQGDWFDTSTGVYTAPISGVYHILVNQHNNQVDAEHVTLQVKVGGSPEIVVCSGKLSESLNTLVHLDTGQSMWLEAISDDPENIGVILNGLVSFGAFKVD